MIWSFHGGLELPENKDLSNAPPSTVAPVAERLVLPLQQHIGLPAEPQVKVGDRVLKGQLLADGTEHLCAPVHAPSSGTVVALEPHSIPHPSGLSTDCLVLKTDGKEEWREREPCKNYRELDRRTITQRIRNAGVVGLGGAVFPTHAKVCCPTQPVETLIINGAECEPYITCDDRLMRERPGQIIEGIHILQHALDAPHCIIGIEDNKTAAAEALQQVITLMGDEDNIEIKRVPTLYPSGGERQLVKLLTGKEVPRGGLPAHIGIMCQNVGTAAAVYDAVVEDRPLISRMVTVTGHGVAVQHNMEVLIGTPIRDLIDWSGGYEADHHKLVIGGPMMGFAVPSDDLPVIKSTNCILAAGAQEFPRRPAPMACIRCGECAKVCPAELVPQQLYWFARAKDFEKAAEYKLDACIECGACSYVCPSQIPLVDYYRYAKGQIRAQDADKKRAEHAKMRHDVHEARIAREAAERAARRSMKRKALDKAGPEADQDAKRAAVTAAVERAKAKKAAASESVNTTHTEQN